MFREIEAAARFKVGLAKLDETKQLQAIVDGAPKAARPAAFRVAAVVAGLVVGGAVIYGAVVSLRVPVMGATVAEASGRFRTPLPTIQTKAIMRFRDTEEPEPTFELPAEPSVISLKVLPAIEGEESYRALLSSINEDGRSQVGAAAKLKPADDFFVTLFLNSTKMSPGRYEVIVVPEGSPANSSHSSGFTFELKRKQY
jgi:hypothetical protein